MQSLHLKYTAGLPNRAVGKLPNLATFRLQCFFLSHNLAWLLSKQLIPSAVRFLVSLFVSVPVLVEGLPSRSRRNCRAARTSSNLPAWAPVSEPPATQVTFVFVSPQISEQTTHVRPVTQKGGLQPPSLVPRNARPYYSQVHFFDH